MEWNDSVVSENTALPLAWLIFSLAGSAVSGVMMFKCVFILKNISEKFIFLLGALYVLFWLYRGYILLTEGRYFVRNIFIKNNVLEVENGIHKKIALKYSEIKSISDNEPKWKIIKPNFYKSDKNGFIITLKDGRFFRVSPHMERIDDLKSELQRLIQTGNKQGESH